jgi:DNA (cytosine-5)-methyltransferase 1
MNVLDLYSGMGGFGQGFKSKFDVLDAVDFWKDACNTYSLNHKETRIHNADVWSFIETCISKDYSGIVYHGIIGGPPCQEFSQLNQSPNEKSVRASQLQIFVKIVEELKPEFAMIENVATLPKELKEKSAMILKKAGYEVIHRTVKAYDYGSIQLRRRWILTACKTRTIFPQSQPNSRAASEIISEKESYMKMSDEIRKQLQSLPSGKWVALPGKRWKEYFIIDPKKPLPAIVNVLKNRIVKPDRLGYVSLDDIKKAQGFDESYEMFGTLTSKAQQLANAIPVELASSFAHEFFEKLKGMN